MIQPTEYGIRSDSKGDGNYGAPRGSRKHKGIDWKAYSGQKFNCPWDEAVFIRTIYPYSDLEWTGGVYEVRDGGTKYFAIVYYIKPIHLSFGRYVKGQMLGIVQNISEKYDDDMDDHVHIEMYKTFDYSNLIS